jgi:hypothetical protein
LLNSVSYAAQKSVILVKAAGFKLPLTPLVYSIFGTKLRARVFV